MKFVGTAALLLAAVPGLALAQTSATPAAEAAKPVTRTEISNRLDSDYADLDADKDGKVGAAEIEARLRKGVAAQLEELKKERDAAFAKLDGDGNGSISRAEFDAKAKLPTAREPEAKPFLDRFDANKDGSITKEEFRAPTLANFTSIDLDKDGTRSPAEQKSAKARQSSQSDPIGR